MKLSTRTIQTASPSPIRTIGVCAWIVILVWVVFAQTLWHDFVNYDDKTYVYGNSLVNAGVKWHSLARAFVDTYTNNWHPLTLISHMIDCQIFDLKAGGHHFTNVLLHTTAALLLFLFLCDVTRRFWSSAFVAALFAIHPLRVESVAWVAERKDVLSAAFFFLTLIAYVRYARALSFGRYLTMSILFACGLMSKPMLVTTPMVLLLLDYWPLKRLRDLKLFWRLTSEKIPLFGLSFVSAAITLALQVHSPTSVDQLPFAWRLENAVVSCVAYIWQIFWPVDLAVFYPHPDDRLAWWQVGLAALFLTGMTWSVFALRRSRPYLLVGWLWYLIMLLPVIGIVEVGLQGHADRYTYLPHLGLYIGLTWLIAELSISLPHRKEILASAGTVIVLTLTACAWKQTTYWRNSETLWTHTLGTTKGNDIALTNMGVSLKDRGQLEDALSYFERALAVRSSSKHSHYRLSLAIIQDNMGEVLARKGRMDDAASHFWQAISSRPDYPDAHYNLGVLFFRNGDFDRAIEQWRTTLSISRNDPGTHAMLANALVQKGLFREASDHYEIALRSEPDASLPLNNLAWLLSTGPDESLRNGAKAVELAARLNQVTNRNNPFFIRTLAAAYAEAGRFENAVEAGQVASDLANAQGQQALARLIEEETDLYRRHLPFRDPTLRNAQ
ncbi:MAG TPA: tetratricopeptide repeat protein [Chthoniobacterales bacterium]|nr:tetratricopeptide repeat protein [Chthoniobacterales bacterium]